MGNPLLFQTLEQLTIYVYKTTYLPVVSLSSHLKSLDVQNGPVEIYLNYGFGLKFDYDSFRSNQVPFYFAQ